MGTVTVASETEKEANRKMQLVISEIYYTLCVHLDYCAVNLNELCIKMPKILLHFPFFDQQTAGNQMQGAFGCSNSQLQRTDVGPETKKQRNKRAQRTGEKAAPRSKKRKKEDEEKQAIYPNADTFIQLKQVGMWVLGDASRKHLEEWAARDGSGVGRGAEFLSRGWRKCELSHNQEM